MSPERARIFLVEDNTTLREMLERAVQLDGHEVITTANSYESASKLIPQLGELAINVALLDGKLLDGKLAGEQVAAAIQDRYGSDITLVDISSGGEMPGVSHHADKNDFDTLNQIIKEA